MKKRISVTLDEATLSDLKKVLSSKKFRNVSHAVETAIDRLVEDENE
jgi:Arc/MetJ-type ribon-helix-helix transcriptional regulator